MGETDLTPAKGDAMPAILVLDDEPFMLKLIIRTLSNLGYLRVGGCDNGLAALDRIRVPGDTPDVILCDLNMPEMDGMAFVRNLVGQRFAGSMILISGEDERMLQTAEALVRAHGITMLGHLRKPVQPAALTDLLSRWSPKVCETQRAQRKMYGADDFRAALAGDQIHMHYQPKVSVISGQVVGVEALARWWHPEDGLVMPDQFIGVAEENGLIDELTKQALTKALDQARRWREEGLPLKVAVNLSTDNLTSVGFADFVCREAERAGVAPQDVVLELTESRLIKDLRAPLEVLARLRMKRFHISIDDFGTGHSSLAQLRDLPFSELKIDRGFVHGAWNNDTKRVIYDASCGLARQLGMDIVAEGVETQEDWRFLRETNCGLAQGYFIAKPMEASALPGWLPTWKARLAELSGVRS